MVVDNITGFARSPCSELAGCSFRWSCSGRGCRRNKTCDGIAETRGMVERTAGRSRRAAGSLPRPRPVHTPTRYEKGDARMTPKPPALQVIWSGDRFNLRPLDLQPQQRGFVNVASQHYAGEVLIRIEAIQPRP